MSIRFSGGSFTQAGSEAARQVSVNTPLSVSLYPVFCVLLLFAVMGFAAADRMSIWGSALTGGATFVAVFFGGMLPIISAEAVAANRRVARALVYMQLSGMGLVYELLQGERLALLDAEAGTLLVLLAWPVLATAWLFGPTTTARYFDVLAGKPPHASLLSVATPTPILDAMLKGFDRILEWIWVSFAFAILLYGALFLLQG